MRDMQKQNILLTVDIVVFTVIQGDLKILLIKRKYDPYKGKYAIPGGFVKNEEPLHVAALRELSEETGVHDVYLKKLTAYGDPKRDPRGRVVTIVYMVLVDAEKYRLSATTDSAAAEWVNAHDLPSLAFDHQMIVTNALKDLRYEIQTTNIASQMLPDLFTLTELQKTYESILGVELDKRNFRKRIAALDILKPTRETKMEGAHRPALLYKFKDEKYKPLKEKIHVIV
ncbi:MAG: NUDIX domain-containing protein [Nanoarchaeota archaeon]